VVDIPVTFGAGLVEGIDLLRTLVERTDYLLDALTDEEADWMSANLIEQGSQRRSDVIGRAEELLEVDENREEPESAVYENVSTPPPWFFLLTESDLDKIVSLPTVAPTESPLSIHVFERWERPRVGMFAEPSERRNLQHIVAAFVVGHLNGRFDIW
jgi:hypothetical protein